MPANFTNIINVTSNIQQYLPYINNGLTFVSDNPQIVPRTNEGVIKVEENKPLIIEPTRYRISNRSVLKVVDTQFNFYNFPATVNVQESDTAEVEDVLVEADPVYARYRPSTNNQILSGNQFSGIAMDFVEDGLIQKAVNNYYISKDLKNSGVNLRFRIQIQHRYDTTTAGGFGTCYFSIIKNSPETGLNREFRGPFANNTTFTPPQGTDGFGYIRQYEVQTLNLDLVIPNSDFEIGDYFQIGAIAGQDTETDFHTINSVQSYWTITDASKNVDEWNQPVE
jgi:hypothetical protein